MSNLAQRFVELDALLNDLLDMAVRLAYFFRRSIVTYVLQNSCRAGTGKIGVGPFVWVSEHKKLFKFASFPFLFRDAQVGRHCSQLLLLTK